MKKKNITISILTLAIISIAGCAGDSSTMSSSATATNSIEYAGYDDSFEMNDEYDMNYSESIDVDELLLNNKVSTKTTNNSKKLVYESTIRIDTLEFNEACLTFNDLVNTYHGFIETKTVEDNGGYSVYIYDNDIELQHTLRATVRIPSDKYDDFMSKISDIGDVRTSTENVTNMTQTYGTLQAQLEIYETEYNRYLDMLSETTDEATMLAIQEDLTQISVEIATIKSQMAYIDTDVAYSTIDIVIQEVSEYEEERDTSTFGHRLKNTLIESWNELLEFLEDVLFAIILNWYRVLFLIAVIMLIVKFMRWKKNHKKRKRVNKQEKQVQDEQVKSDSNNE